MSLLIYQAMQEAAQRGCWHWNWGGTWLTQDGVYRFKNRWGAQSKPYFYYIREYARACPLRNLTAKEILAEYPNFYVLPFNVLEKGQN
jgi:lipid II:glycine glycyltransferase (peptidoglycan interpeptide bridge formation enzyme)